jgi:hypothetical protein
LGAVKAFDMYIVETPADARVCATAGVFDFTLFDMECENCAMALGPVDDAWIPTAVVSDSDGASWVVCVDCVSSVIFPGEWAARL